MATALLFFAAACGAPEGASDASVTDASNHPDAISTPCWTLGQGGCLMTERCATWFLADAGASDTNRCTSPGSRGPGEECEIIDGLDNCTSGMCAWGRCSDYCLWVGDAYPCIAGFCGRVLGTTAICLQPCTPGSDDCAPGEECYLNPTGMGEPGCAPPGPGALGEPCSLGPDCEAGSVCAAAAPDPFDLHAPEERICRRTCELGPGPSSCAPSETCIAHETGALGVCVPPL